MKKHEILEMFPKTGKETFWKLDWHNDFTSKTFELLLVLYWKPDVVECRIILVNNGLRK